jgi:hypothetical protein
MMCADYLDSELQRIESDWQRLRLAQEAVRAKTLVLLRVAQSLEANGKPCGRCPACRSRRVATSAGGVEVSHG